MANSSNWSFHCYYTDAQYGLQSKLDLSSAQTSFLKLLRKASRMRIREAFSEAQSVFKDVKMSTNDDLSRESLKNTIKAKRSFQHVDGQILSTLISLAQSMDEEQRQAFLKIKPKFRTQGSFEYKTLNVPYCKPPQEMDIDDGVYFPMQMFDDVPALAHRLMIALVDSALQSLVSDNCGWKFDDSKPTCARIRVAEKNVHLDVPMYAIPEEKFKQILESAGFENYGVSQESIKSFGDEDIIKLDKDSVYLARRDKDKWQKSDPQVIQQWFTDSVSQVGEHLRGACRLLKAWRDVHWISGGGPSSIALMKCVVDTVGSSELDGKDLDLVMHEVVKALPIQLVNGVESPDPSDDRPLFPSRNEHDEYHQKIVDAASMLSEKLKTASAVASKTEAGLLLKELFGDRGVDDELIKPIITAHVYSTPATKSNPAIIKQTMKSG